MSAELVQSYNEQVLSREPHELVHSSPRTEYKEVGYTVAEEVNDDKSVEDEQQQAYRSRNTSTSSSGQNSEVEHQDSRGYQQQNQGEEPQEAELHHQELKEEPLQKSDETVEDEEEEEQVIEIIKEVKIEVTESKEDRKPAAPIQRNTDTRPIPKPLAQREITSAPMADSVKSLEKDENDWARKNQGRGKINALIARFNNGSVLNENNDNVAQYKSDYGVGKGKGQLRQDVFH
ncbi:unnamed protein product [Bursaphelenchus xylophilus]|uniref:(pine wood nematode) hypothetical protein n=1 Tax=Bursaphelenchus xylophilus TaxID=6326 RepID=A0A1I7SMK1_BURXY|nr:unnamed protein product [Bursaphelenchus xylophilus]CAG9130260.1 unnamed protein product [Bursaphelenchus xylophilus]